MTIRRAPRFFPFLITGVVFGILVALAVFFLGSDAQGKDWASVLALISVIGAALGGLVAVAVALVIERVLVAKTKSTAAAKLEG